LNFPPAAAVEAVVSVPVLPDSVVVVVVVVVLVLEEALPLPEHAANDIAITAASPPFINFSKFIKSFPRFLTSP
jgi:hypothetical protein